MREESSVVLNRSIGEPRLEITYLAAVEEELQKTKKKLERERTIREYYESVLLKYPVKEEKGEFKKIETVFPYELWEKGLTGYGAEEEEMEILKPIARVDRGMFASSDFFAIPEVLQRQNVESKVKLSTSLQTIFSTTLKSQSLTATASVTTIISLFALYYGFLRGYWALVGIGIMSLVVVFIDLWKASLRESREHERSAIKAY
uniref:Uncharacterized protein n=1 Tax=Candidatus Methanophagaceae archaeon ANME-1 ERB6 TaxID=2759912 RepID=A0A7G9YW01_9EURY|nr:hypothetical protein LFOEMHHC_00011 [Methanosarcinales archaeon ANME-1 ERB6]